MVVVVVAWLLWWLLFWLLLFRCCDVDGQWRFDEQTVAHNVCTVANVRSDWQQDATRA
jgi:hypothetical protein